MKKLKIEEMKKVSGGLDCGPRCECVVAFSTVGGMDLMDAIDYCTDLFGPGTP